MTKLNENLEIGNSGVKLNNLVVNSTLSTTQQYFSSSNLNLEEGTYDFELKIVFRDSARNVFLVVNGLWNDTKACYGFVNYGANTGNTPYYESAVNNATIGMGVANNQNSHWTVFTGTFTITAGQFSIRGQGASVEGMSMFSGKIERASLTTINSLSFISTDWAYITSGTRLKIWKRVS